VRSCNYRLLDSDVYSYYPAPKFWFRWKHKNYRKEQINGFWFRLWKVGFSCHVGPGVYHNGRKWIGYWYDEYQEWLADGGL
jgi:hypothetical protein